MLNGKSEPASIKDLLLEFKGKEEWGDAFKGVNQSGAGGSGAQGGGTPPATGKKRSEMQPDEKVAYIKTHGLPKYQALPE